MQDDQRPQGVHHAQAAEDDEEGHHGYLIGQHHGRQHQEEADVAPGPAQPGKAVGDQRAGEQGQRDRRHGDGQRVPQLLEKGEIAQRFGIVRPAEGPGNPDGRQLEDLIQFLERSGHQPEEGQKEQQAEREQPRVPQQLAPEPLGGARTPVEETDGGGHGGRPEGLALLLAFVVHEARGRLEDEQGGRHDDEEQDPGHGGGVRHLEVLEGVLVEVQGVEARSVQRPAPGHDEGLRENLEAVDQADDEIEEDHGRQHGQGHVAHPRPGAGPVDHGRFVELDGDILQPGQEDDQRAADGPHPHDDERRFGQFRHRQPAGTVNAEEIQQGVDQPVFRVEDPQPEDGRGHHGHDRGQVIDGAVHRDALEIQVQHQRQEHGQQDVKGNADHDHVEGVVQGLPKQVVLEKQFLEVGEPDPDHGFAQAGVYVQAIVERRDDGKEREPAKTQDPRQGERYAHPQLPALLAGKPYGHRGL